MIGHILLGAWIICAVFCLAYVGTRASDILSDMTPFGIVVFLIGIAVFSPFFAPTIIGVLISNARERRAELEAISANYPDVP